MRKEDIIAFVQRDWAAIAEHKRQWQAEQAKRRTPAEALALGDELRHYAYKLHPDWPTEEHRREDFAVHVRVSESLARVHAIRGR